MKYLVLGIKGYDFKDSEGDNKKGATLYYIDEPLSLPLMRGYVPYTVTVGLEMVNKIADFPCVCDIEFRKVPNSKGKAVEVFESLKFISAADCFNTAI